MEAPPDERESTEGVVIDNFSCTQENRLIIYGKALSRRTAVEVSVTSLCTQNQESTNHTIGNNGKSI